MLHPKAGFFAPQKFTPPCLEDCRRCPHRRTYPYFFTHAYHQTIQAAIAQGQASAWYLRRNAAQLREAVSQAGNLCCLLKANEALEEALNQALCLELRSIETL